MASTLIKHGPTVVIRLSSNLDSDQPINELRAVVDKLLQEGNSRLVLNLADVTTMNSYGIVALTSIQREYAKRGGTVKLCQLEKSITNILLLTKLSMIFECHRTEDEATFSFTPTE